MAMTKTEEQICKEKAAVESLKKADANMQLAIQRIRTLEATLSSTKEDIERLRKCFTGSLGIQIVKGGNWAYEDITTYTKTMIQRIDGVL